MIPKFRWENAEKRGLCLGVAVQWCDLKEGASGYSGGKLSRMPFCFAMANFVPRVHRMECEQRESGWLRNAHHLAANAILLLNVVGFHWANTVEKHVKSEQLILNRPA